MMLKRPMTGSKATNTTSGGTTNAIVSDYERIGQLTSDLARSYAYIQQTLLNCLAYVSFSISEREHIDGLPHHHSNLIN